MKTIYLATAYGKSGLWGKLVMWLRYYRVSKVAGYIIKAGHNVFSPITHSHTIAWICRLPHLDHELWLTLDKWYVDACDEVWVYNQKGWKESYGVKREIEWALEDNKSVYLVNKYGQVLRQILEA
jgi:hypothetical protein